MKDQEQKIRAAYQGYMMHKYPGEKSPSGKFAFFDAVGYKPPRIALLGDPVFVNDESIWALRYKEINKEVVNELIGKGSTIPETGWYLVTGKLRLFLGTDAKSAVSLLDTWAHKFKVGDLS